MRPGPGFRFRPGREDPSVEALVERYRSYGTPDISDMCNRLYTMSEEIRDLSGAGPLVGTACTVKVFPGDNLVDTQASSQNAVIGDVIASKAKHRRIAGFVIDGLIRDVDGVREVGLPVYARGVTPVGPLHRGPGEINYPVSSGGIVVNPGDLIVADENGVVVVREDFAELILQRLDAHAGAQKDYLEAVARGDFSNDWVDEHLEASGCMRADD